MDLIRRTLARLQPVTDGHTQGNLTVHALRMASADSAIAAAPPPYLCLAQALDQGLIDIEEISESGSVASLEARNRSEQPVFLLDGEELVGAKQNRVTNASILLPARSVATSAAPAAPSSRRVGHAAPPACRRRCRPPTAMTRTRARCGKTSA